METSLGEFEYR